MRKPYRVIAYKHTEDANVTNSNPAVQPSGNGVYKANIEKITLLVNYKF